MHNQGTAKYHANDCKAKARSTPIDPSQDNESRPPPSPNPRHGTRAGTEGWGPCGAGTAVHPYCRRVRRDHLLRVRPARIPSLPSAQGISSHSACPPHQPPDLLHLASHCWNTNLASLSSLRSSSSGAKCSPTCRFSGRQLLTAPDSLAGMV